MEPGAAMEENAGGEYLTQKKIYYHDTDCGGVVYYANYLKYFEEARTEFFTSRRVDLRRLADGGVFFVVARVEIDYKAPAKYQDVLSIHTSVARARRSLVEFAQRATREGTVIAEARTIIMCVGRDLRTITVPPVIAEAISAE
jgi:acyl-CoA thioester hydrolase